MHGRECEFVQTGPSRTFAWRDDPSRRDDRDGPLTTPPGGGRIERGTRSETRIQSSACVGATTSFLFQMPLREPTMLNSPDWAEGTCCAREEGARDA